MRVSFAFPLTVALLTLAAACAPVESPAYPLYPKIEAGPGPGKISLLRGPIAIVDGEGVVGKGRAFELLPGCHLVAVDSGSDTPPNVIFAFRMRPGYIYTVEPGAQTARERAPDGSEVLVPRASAKDVTSCRSWAKAERY